MLLASAVRRTLLLLRNQLPPCTWISNPNFNPNNPSSIPGSSLKNLPNPNAYPQNLTNPNPTPNPNLLPPCTSISQVGKLADLVLWNPKLFGAKPEMIIKAHPTLTLCLPRTAISTDAYHQMRQCNSNRNHDENLLGNPNSDTNATSCESCDNRITSKPCPTLTPTPTLDRHSSPQPLCYHPRVTCEA